MFTKAAIARAATTFSKNLITTQTNYNLISVLGSPVFDPTYGMGISTSTSVAVAVTCGGFANQRVTSVMRWRAPTTSPNEEIGAMGRLQTFASGNQTYYYARCDGGVFKLTRVNDNSFNNIATTAFALSADVDVTIVLLMNGTAISASATATGLGTVNLSGTDSTITAGGLGGFRTLSTAGWCSSILVEQL